MSLPYYSRFCSNNLYLNSRRPSTKLHMHQRSWIPSTRAHQAPIQSTRRYTPTPIPLAANRPASKQNSSACSQQQQCVPSYQLVNSHFYAISLWLICRYMHYFTYLSQQQKYPSYFISITTNHYVSISVYSKIDCSMSASHRYYIYSPGFYTNIPLGITLLSLSLHQQHRYESETARKHTREFNIYLGMYPTIVIKVILVLYNQCPNATTIISKKPQMIYIKCGRATAAQYQYLAMAIL